MVSNLQQKLVSFFRMMESSLWQLPEGNMSMLWWALAVLKGYDDLLVQWTFTELFSIRWKHNAKQARKIRTNLANCFVIVCQGMKDIMSLLAVKITVLGSVTVCLFGFHFNLLEIKVCAFLFWQKKNVVCKRYSIELERTHWDVMAIGLYTFPCSWPTAPLKSLDLHVSLTFMPQLIICLHQHSFTKSRSRLFPFTFISCTCFLLKHANHHFTLHLFCLSTLFHAI